MSSVLNLGVFVNGWEFLVRLGDNQFLKDSTPGSSFAASKEFQVRDVQFMSHSDVIISFRNIGTKDRLWENEYI